MLVACRKRRAAIFCRACQNCSVHPHVSGLSSYTLAPFNYAIMTCCGSDSGKTQIELSLRGTGGG